MEFINNFGFSQSDIEYLREEGNYPEEFLHYLQNLKFTGTIRGMREGELVFANEPILRIEAPLAEAQLIETPC